VKRILLIAAVLASVPTAAHAFCGFYVNGAGSEMFNDATQVVLMRMGTRTVLSMQNDYRGPLDDFAMVVPVPAVLHEGDVKTLPKEVFAKVDVMGAPRLVEYWEQDPCMQIEYDREERAYGGAAMALDEGKMGKKDADYHVTVEAKFTVGEYNIVILSATQATGLEAWLTDNHYKIPAGAAELLRPYVEGGMKFFVAKVDPAKVKMVDGRAALSPLRFHYDSEEFALPIRLGLANSSGKQDLIVSILAPNQRYEVANYKNVTIPTNINVQDSVKDTFAEFYAALFDRTVEKNPGAVVTEYAWAATTCDPCPGPQLDYGDFATLGADVLGGGKGAVAPYQNGDFVMTRLHARYGKDSVPNDLVFKQAKPIVGGREFMASNGKLEERATESDENNFQGRYIIRHEWPGAIACANPRRGVWGGPPDGSENATKPATGTAFVKSRHARLPTLVAQDIPEIDVRAAGASAKPGPQAPRPASSPRAEEAEAHPSAGAKRGCGCQGSGDASGGALLVLGVMFAMRRRREERARA
jgi:MYXO-CTERM domain-containing protein